MSLEETATLTRILSSAKAEFLEKGFKSASLRNIVKTAGVTTGAFYGYFSSKGELFSALVDKDYRHFISVYRSALDSFENLPAHEKGRRLIEISENCVNGLFEYMKDRRDIFYLILKCSDGTPYAGFIDEIVSMEVESTHKYYKVLENLGQTPEHMDERLEHVLVTGMMNAYFEFIIHDMPVGNVKQYLKQLSGFYHAGWREIMGQQKTVQNENSE